jgi:hypothetical protein
MYVFFLPTEMALAQDKRRERRREIASKISVIGKSNEEVRLWWWVGDNQSQVGVVCHTFKERGGNLGVS